MPKRNSGRWLSLSVIVSLVLHAAFILWFILRPVRPRRRTRRRTSRSPRYVELIQQNPREFTEAPGPAVDKAPLNAAFSDANRKASTPNADRLDADEAARRRQRSLHAARAAPAARRQRASRRRPSRSRIRSSPPSRPSHRPSSTPPPNDTFVYREPRRPTKASAAASAVDWRNAIREVKGPIGGGDGIPIRAALPVAAASAGWPSRDRSRSRRPWYDWGPYAQSMVSSIRVNWYANMPQLIRTGIGGVVTIRFTIQRDGRITDITLLKSSGHPPYDFAARKAIELSSPLNPLPADFPNRDERVTAMFYYNTRIPG